MEAVSMRGYGFAYPQSEQKALDGIDFTIPKGGFVLLCGRSGSGKSTLLRALKREIAPHGEKTGRVQICGKDAECMTARESACTVGFVMQDPENQIVTDTVWHELAFGLENLGYDTEVIRRRVAETAHFFGIGPWFQKKVNELSGGQKQILNLAATLAMQAEIIVLDEPTAQLDPVTAAEFLQVLRRINTELGKTVILSEHRLEDALPASDSVLYLRDAHTAFYGDVSGFIRFLCDQRDDFHAALPAAAHIAHRIGEEGTYPVSVREGRAWVEKNKDKLKAEEKTLCGNGRDAVVISARDLWYRYDKKDDFVLQGTRIAVKEGALHCVVGGNGSGKSTLLAVLAGVYHPARGSVKIASGKKIAMLAQNPKAVFVCDTLGAELAEGLDGREDEIVQIARRMGLTELFTRHPYDLSGGEMQKAALAKLLLRRPDILLLDEPTKGMDALAKQEMAEILLELVKERKTVVVVTHDLEFAARYATHISMMFCGDVIANGTGRAFFEGNNFYTTSTNRMTRGILDGCVVAEDVVHA